MRGLFCRGQCNGTKRDFSEFVNFINHLKHFSDDWRKIYPAIGKAWLSSQKGVHAPKRTRRPVVPLVYRRAVLSIVCEFSKSRPHSLSPSTTSIPMSWLVQHFPGLQNTPFRHEPPRSGRSLGGSVLLCVRA